jgi:hypothetical protein
MTLETVSSSRSRPTMTNASSSRDFDVIVLSDLDCHVALPNAAFILRSAQ